VQAVIVVKEVVIAVVGKKTRIDANKIRSIVGRACALVL
jgi:hypothetical protein